MILPEIGSVLFVLLLPVIMIGIYIWLWYIRIAEAGMLLLSWPSILASYFFLLSLLLLWHFLLLKIEINFSWGDWLFLGLIVPLMVFDNRYLLLPDPAVFTLLWLGILLAYLGVAPQKLETSILGVMLGYGVMWLIYWFGYSCYRREVLGRGDLKFSAAIGAWIGVGNIFNFLFVSALIGLIWALFVRCCKGKESYEEIPFGPSLGISGIIFYFIARLVVSY